jgi:nucleoside-diphosphate-sugar epimerase
VFASSVAVYGALGPDHVHESQPPRPALSYGAHKLMAEIELADLSRRGTLDAVSLRLPGIVARPPSESGHGSAFMSLVMHKVAAGQPYVPGRAKSLRMVDVAALLHRQPAARRRHAD